MKKLAEVSLPLAASDANGVGNHVKCECNSCGVKAAKDKFVAKRKLHCDYKKEINVRTLATTGDAMTVNTPKPEPQAATWFPKITIGGFRAVISLLTLAVVQSDGATRQGSAGEVQFVKHRIAISAARASSTSLSPVSSVARCGLRTSGSNG